MTTNEDKNYTDPPETEREEEVPDDPPWPLPSYHEALDAIEEVWRYLESKHRSQGLLEKLQKFPTQKLQDHRTILPCTLPTQKLQDPRTKPTCKFSNVKNPRITHSTINTKTPPSTTLTSAASMKISTFNINQRLPNQDHWNAWFTWSPISLKNWTTSFSLLLQFQCIQSLIWKSEQSRQRQRLPLHFYRQLPSSKPKYHVRYTLSPQQNACP